MNVVIAVDTGGTFSDCVVIDEAGRIARGKAPSTPPDYERGVLDAVASAADSLGIGPRELLTGAQLFGHGTTVATNTLLTRTGARTGLVTTRGHEDVLLIGRTLQKVAGLADAAILDISRLKKPVPIVPRSLTRGVDERVDRDGREVVPMDLERALDAVDDLVAQGVEAVAVCFLWSFLAPEHERRLAAAIRERHPGLMVTASSEVAPVMKEYERCAHTAINAYVSPRTRRYLVDLSSRLSQAGLRGPAVVMGSGGGVKAVARVLDRGAELLTSGPAGGVMGAAILGRALGIGEIITADVGGTSFDVSLIVDGRPAYSDAPVFGQYHLSLPVIDVATIGAGGGSIAWIEAATGALRVGPMSAGADPGPAAYGRGASAPTVTDANLVLGRINPDYFLGGARRLDVEAARRAVAQVAEPLGLELTEAAQGIVDIVDGHMADLLRRITVERGHDPREFALMAFGGAGPLHVASFAPVVGVREAIVPGLASVFSAFGIAGSDVAVIAETSEPMRAPLAPQRLQAIFDRLGSQVQAELMANAVATGEHTIERCIRLRYRGQVHEVEGRLPPGPVTQVSAGAAVADFEARYQGLYGQGSAYGRAGIEAMRFVVRGFGPLTPPRLVPAPLGPEDPTPAWVGQRPVHLGGCALVTTPVYRAEALRPGMGIKGPAVIEAFDTTVLVAPGQRLVVDGLMNLRLTWERSED